MFFSTEYSLTFPAANYSKLVCLITSTPTHCFGRLSQVIFGSIKFLSHLQCVSWAARLYLSQHIMFPHLAISYPPGLLSLGHDLEKVGESNASMPDILARAPMSSVLPLAAKQGSQTLQEACLQKDLSCPVILQLAQACSVRPITADIRCS